MCCLFPISKTKYKQVKQTIRCKISLLQGLLYLQTEIDNTRWNFMCQREGARSGCRMGGNLAANSSCFHSGQVQQCHCIEPTNIVSTVCLSLNWHSLAVSIFVTVSMRTSAFPQSFENP